MSIRRWAGDKMGLLMITVTLMVIAAITVMLYSNDRENRLASVHSQGNSLVRLLSGMPYEVLATRQTLQLINIHSSSDFAYAMVVDQSGQPLQSLTATGVQIPGESRSADGSLWVSHQFIEQSGRKLIEYSAPLLRDSEQAGRIRVAYFEPGLWPQRGEISLIASLALPIFLLVPCFYLMFKFEMRPLQQARSQIERLLSQQQVQQVNVSANGEFNEFIQRFNQFVTMVGNRMDELNQENALAQESTLLMNYQRRRIEAALESMPDAIVVMDESGKTTFCNNRLDTMFGIQASNIVGKMPHEWCSDEDAINLLAKYHSNVTRLRRSESVEFSPKKKPEKLVTVSAYPLFSPRDRDNIFGTLVVFRDTTEARIASQARDDFISHVAHELKSPLNVINMYAELMMEDGDNLQTRTDGINIITDEVERMTQLINNLLNLSKIEAGSISLNRQRVKLSDFLKDCFETISRSGMRDDIQFKMEVPADTGAISLDKDLIRMALNNFLSNAVKYNVPGGTVSMQLGEDTDYYTVRISDTGIGIAETDQERIFDKFYRSDSEEVTQRNGHGLGLSLAREIIDLHQGHIDMTSTPGQGTTFTISLKKSQSFLKEAV